MPFATLIRDTFDGPAGSNNRGALGNLYEFAPNTGDTWHPGVFDRSLRLNGSGGCTPIYVQDSLEGDAFCSTYLNWADVWCEVTVNVTVHDIGSTVSLYFGIQATPQQTGATDTSYGVVRWTPINGSNSAKLEIGPHGSGFDPLIIDLLPGYFGTHTFKVFVTAGVAYIYIDGVEVAARTFTLSNGYVGFGLRGKTTGVTTGITALSFIGGTNSPNIDLKVFGNRTKAQIGSHPFAGRTATTSLTSVSCTGTASSFSSDFMPAPVPMTFRDSWDISPPPEFGSVKDRQLNSFELDSNFSFLRSKQSLIEYYSGLNSSKFLSIWTTKIANSTHTLILDDDYSHFIVYTNAKIVIQTDMEFPIGYAFAVTWVQAPGYSVGPTIIGQGVNTTLSTNFQRVDVLYSGEWIIT